MTQIVHDLFSRFSPTLRGVSAKRLNIAVVGGGPAGLLLAWKLLDAGNKVTLFEKRKEYQLNQAPDPRSYNLTADGLGRYRRWKSHPFTFWSVEPSVRLPSVRSSRVY